MQRSGAIQGRCYAAASFVITGAKGEGAPCPGWTTPTEGLVDRGTASRT